MSAAATPTTVDIAGCSAGMAGITLESGDSVTIVWTGVFAHPITDGFSPTGGGGVVSDDLLGGNDTCTVTAE
jgi:hypothetical protein